MTDISKLPTTTETPTESQVDSARREALGRFARYTAPVMLAMLLTPKDAVAGGAASN